MWQDQGCTAFEFEKSDYLIGILPTFHIWSQGKKKLAFPLLSGSTVTVFWASSKAYRGRQTTYCANRVKTTLYTFWRDQKPTWAWCEWHHHLACLQRCRLPSLCSQKDAFPYPTPLPGSHVLGVTLQALFMLALEEGHVVRWSLYLSWWWSRSHLHHMAHGWRISRQMFSPDLQVVTGVCNGLGMYYGREERVIGCAEISRWKKRWNEHEKILRAGSRGYIGGVLQWGGPGLWSGSVSTG